MKKFYLFFVLSCLSLGMWGQNWSDAGLPWSKDCSSGKPSIRNAYTINVDNQNPPSYYSCVDWDYEYGYCLSYDYVSYGSKAIDQPYIDNLFKNLYGIGYSNKPTGTQIDVIKFPAGYYYLVGNVTIPVQNVVIQGDGIGTVFQAVNSGSIGFINGKYNGIESLKIIGGGTGSQSILLQNCQYSWIKGVESQYGAQQNHILIYKGSNNEVSGCYIHDAFSFSNSGGGFAYGIHLLGDAGQYNYADGTYSNLISNNVLRRLRHHILLQGRSRNNVITFNYLNDSEATNDGFAADNTVGMIDFHSDGRDWGTYTDPTTGDGPGGNLIEGNVLEAGWNVLFSKIKYYRQLDSNRKKGKNTGWDSFYKNNFGDLVNANSTGSSGEVEVAPNQTYYSSRGLGNNCSGTNPSVFYGSYYYTPIFWHSISYTNCNSTNPAEYRYDNWSNKTMVTCGSNPNNFTSTTNGIVPAATPLSAYISIDNCSYNYDYCYGNMTYLYSSPGYVSVSISGGVAPYTINVNGSIYTTYSTYAWYNNSDDGSIVVVVSDANNQTVTMYGDNTCNTNIVSYCGGYMRQANPNATIEEPATSEINAVTTQNTFSLQAYPNPMSSEMTVRYTLANEDVVTIELMNTMGQVVKTIENGVAKKAGTYELTFNRENLAAGVYQGVLKGLTHTQTFKVIVE